MCDTRNSKCFTYCDLSFEKTAWHSEYAEPMPEPAQKATAPTLVAGLPAKPHQKLAMKGSWTEMAWNTIDDEAG